MNAITTERNEVATKAILTVSFFVKVFMSQAFRVRYELFVCKKFSDQACGLQLFYIHAIKLNAITTERNEVATKAILTVSLFLKVFINQVF